MSMVLPQWKGKGFKPRPVQSGWNSLCLKNDWGSRYYALKKFSQSMARKERQEFKFPAGGMVKIRWPDGKEEEVKVIHVSYTETIDDMGHDYQVSGRLAMFYTTHQGVQIKIGFEKVEVWID